MTWLGEITGAGVPARSRGPCAISDQGRPCGICWEPGAPELHMTWHVFALRWFDLEGPWLHTICLPGCQQRIWKTIRCSSFYLCICISTCACNKNCPAFLATQFVCCWLLYLSDSLGLGVQDLGTMLFASSEHLPNANLSSNKQSQQAELARTESGHSRQKPRRIEHRKHQAKARGTEPQPRHREALRISAENH